MGLVTVPSYFDPALSILTPLVMPLDTSFEGSFPPKRFEVQYPPILSTLPRMVFKIFKAREAW